MLLVLALWVNMGICAMLQVITEKIFWAGVDVYVE